jgi:uridine phosphorylase
MVKPRMSNHHRGLWGYHGYTEEGRELTVQATGIGGPSAVVVLEELALLGLRRAIRIGTCTAPGPQPVAGSALVVSGAIAEDGTSAALGQPAGSLVEPDAELTAALIEATGLGAAAVRSRDLHEGDPSPGGSTPARVGDLQTAALLALAGRRGIRVAAALVVGGAAGRRLEDEPMEAALLRLASAATEALRAVSTST